MRVPLRIERDISPRNRNAAGILVPGRNCWRIARADRVAFLVDSAAYFETVREVLAGARRSIFILSWDVDSRVDLTPHGAHDGLPAALGDFLNEVVTRRRGLRAYVLNWDFAMLYALEREWLPTYKLDWRTHRRLKFCMDGRHPVGASHHQKVVVVDDRIAFVGGLDITRQRWDTPEHSCDNPLRCDPEGNAYPPFHDVQVMVEGPVAAALGELVRARWQRATGSSPKAAPPSEEHQGPSTAWPSGVQPDIVDANVAIARTEPEYEDFPGVGEIRQFYADAIGAARNSLYFENQYFTSAIIGDALEKSLRKFQGPDVVVVSRLMESGWLEEMTMGVLRARLHRRMKAADLRRRYRMYVPHIPGLMGSCLNVHSKVMVMDDEIVTVGSANLSNRSMVLDTECNLVIEARGDTRIRRGIAHFRNRLLAEHLGLTPGEVARAQETHSSLIGAIEALKGPSRSLRAHDPTVAPEVDALVPDRVIIDPEQPIDPNKLVAQFVPRGAERPMSGRLAMLGFLAVFLGLLAVTWRWTPLREFVNLKSLVALATALQGLPLAPLAVLGGFVVGGLVMVPVTLIIGATGIVFGPFTGSLYAITGTLISAFVTYSIGRWVGRDTVRRIASRQVNRMTARIARRGIVAVVIVRMLPIAPFSIINLVAGASQIRLRDFLIGTLLGMSPGIVLVVVFAHHLAEAVRNPSLVALAVLGLLGGLMIGLALFVQRKLENRVSREPHQRA